MAEEEMMEEGMEERAEQAPEQGGPQLNAKDAEQVAKAISDRAVQLMNGMEELGFVVSQMGVPQEQVDQLSQQFVAFMQTLQAILGVSPEGSAPQESGPAPEMGGSQGIPYDQGMAGGAKAAQKTPMVG